MPMLSLSVNFVTRLINPDLEGSFFNFSRGQIKCQNWAYNVGKNIQPWWLGGRASAS